MITILTTIPREPSSIAFLCPCGTASETSHFNAAPSHPEGSMARCDYCGREGAPDDNPEGALANFEERHGPVVREGPCGNGHPIDGSPCVACAEIARVDSQD